MRGCCIFMEGTVCIGGRWGGCVVGCVFGFEFTVYGVWDVCGKGSRCILCVGGITGLYYKCVPAKHTDGAISDTAPIL